MSTLIKLKQLENTTSGYLIVGNGSGVPSWVNPNTINISGFNNDSGYITSSALSPYLTYATAAATYQPIGSYLTSSAIGVTVQGYSANTTLLGNSTTGSGSIVLATSPTFGTQITTPSIVVSGNISAASWTTSGIKYKGVGSTLTNTTSSGTVANTYTNVFGGNTIVSSSATTYTNYYSSFFNIEIAGSGSTFTNNYAAGFGGRVAQINLGGSTYFGSGAGVKDDLTSRANTAFGTSALANVVSGTYHAAFGYEALLNATSSNNVAVGYHSQRGNTTGNENTAIGYLSLFSNQTTAGNTAVGSLSLYQTTGGSNTGVGKNALYDLTSGTLNTCIGWNTGRGITTGGSNTIIGSQITGLTSSLSNNVIIADGAGNRLIRKDANGNQIMGAESALATNATNGFLYVPSCAGVPTGVPTAITGKIPIVVDSTNNIMYIYSGGSWVALN